MKRFRIAGGEDGSGNFLERRLRGSPATNLICDQKSFFLLAWFVRW